MTEPISPTSLGDIAPKMRLKGVVKKVQLAGALIDVGLEECDAFLHISQIRRRRRVKNVSDVLSEGQKVTVWVLNVDKTIPRLDVTLIQPPSVDWDELAVGQVYTGKVVRIEKYGAFVDIGAERPGLVHVSELAHDYVSDPSEVVQKGQEVEVQVIGVDRQKYQIDLSIKALAKPTPQEPVAAPAAAQPEELPTAMALALQRALSGQTAEEREVAHRRAAGRRQIQEEILRRTLERHRS